MKKPLLLCLLLLCLLPQATPGQPRIWDETDAQKAQRLAWWTHDRFGLFVHFGLYAAPARHEWVQARERTSPEEYRKYFEIFNPDLFDAKKWARQAKKAGMKYAVITTKHHEGFCLWDSKYTDYKITNTPFGRDLIKEWVEALRAEGMKVGFYYSLIDWHHPDFTIDQNHPLRPRDKAEYSTLNRHRDMNKYRAYLKNQVRELLTNYGKIDLLWFDFSYPGENGKGRDDWDAIELVKMVRKLQPGIILNDRADLDDVPGGWDFITPEQYMVSQWPTVNGQRVPWETCQTFSGSWGYYRDEKSWKSPKQLLELLIGSVSKGGNLLLNVGPTARGLFDPRAQHALQAIGEWMELNDRSVYGCTEAPTDFKCPVNCMLTYNPQTRRLYVHLLSYPLNALLLPDMADKIKYAQFLHDGSELRMIKPEETHKTEDNTDRANDLYLTLPVTKPEVAIPVIELFLK